MAYTNIDLPAEYFNTVLYTGTGVSLAITGVGFKPDWVWIKERSSTSSHLIFDVLRGTNKKLSSNSTDSEETFAYLSSFDSDGFTIGTGDGAINNLGDTYASWNWKANGTGVSNTQGSITSTVSANTTAGFSIVSYTGTGSLATVGHGLGSAPKMVIAKNRGSTSSWDCYHVGLSGANYRIQLNSTGAQSVSDGSWGSTAPTSSVFTVKDDTATNVSGNTYIAYCFSEVKGYSKFGKYTGNGSTNGPFVYTGFKPAWVICKNTSGANAWTMHDSKRPGYNATNLYVYANANNVEAGDIPHDFLSNGFKIRSTFADTNGSGATYIYMAFAENPFVTSKGIPTTAR